MIEKEVLPHLILKVKVGSHLYGTNTKRSDNDFIGVFIPSIDYVFGLKKIEQVEVRTNPTESGIKNTSQDIDCTYYALPKFIKLCMDANPNILEVLFADHTIEFCNKFGSMLLKNKHLFVSNKIQKTFEGYVESQKKKLQTYDPMGHRKNSVTQFGYDVKAASHIIRLLEECTELLSTGRLFFPLKNAAFIKHVKLGIFSLDDVFLFIKTCEENIKNCISVLPQKPNFDKIQALQKEIFLQYYHLRGEFSYLTESDI